eukprot:TRINITY_DN23000_c0_g3_i1.p3 TRINITY_DN23000_c0_g3~~TRINITY_DN23000_c0_g3_i1.p3  ORF type:complete len:104 (+),score=0.20 TRINITY_DN23000_c0_g3_i1:335-646(+)
MEIYIEKFKIVVFPVLLQTLKRTLSEDVGFGKTGIGFCLLLTFSIKTHIYTQVQKNQYIKYTYFVGIFSRGDLLWEFNMTLNQQRKLGKFLVFQVLVFKIFKT